MKDKFFKIFDYCGEYSLYALIIFIPISIAAIESFFGLIFMFFLLRKSLKPDFKFLRSPSYVFLLSYFIFISFSLFNSGPNFNKSISALFLKWAENIMIYIIVQDTLCNYKRVRNCLIVLLSTALLIGIDALFQRFIGIDFLRHKTMVALYGETIPRAVTASFSHYNSFGAYLIVILSLLLAMLISVKDKVYRLSVFLLLILMQLCLILTFSRGSWMGFFAVLIIMLFLSPKVNKLIYVFFIFIMVMIFLPGIRERALFIFSPGGDTDRFVIWKGTFSMIKEHPFLGMGLGTYMDYFRPFVKKGLIQYAHNCYLQIWAETGIFALISFILFIGSIFYKGIKAFKIKNSNFALLGFICALFGTLVHIFFDNHLYSLQLSALFWLMLGVIVALTKQEEEAVK